MRYWITTLWVLLYSACSTAPIDDDIEVVHEPRVLERAPNGLPIVDAPVFAFTAPDRVVSSEKASIEPFICTDEHGMTCRKPRSSWVNTDLRPWSNHTFYSTGEDGIGAVYSVRNIRNQWYTLQSDPAGGSVNWWFEFPLGSACNNGTYGPQNCTWHICLIEGTPQPRCITTNLFRGATQAFNGESWSPYETLRFEVWMAAWGGPIPMQANFEQIILTHNDITQ